MDAQNQLTIQKMAEGGYLIWPFAGLHDYREPIFACTTIDEALAFIRAMMTEAMGK